MYTSANPKIVDTPKSEQDLVRTSYARTDEGRIDLDAYTGLTGTIVANNLKVDVRIQKARVRYGHLDLNVSPISGTGNVWVERKNIVIPEDPAEFSPSSGNDETKNSKISASKPAGQYPNAFPTKEIRKMIQSIVAEGRAAKKN
jgi:hypothetical protein